MEEKNAPKNTSNDPKNTGPRLAQTTVFSIIFATLFAVLVVIGYGQATKSPSPMHKILRAQENMLEQGEGIVGRLADLNTVAEKTLQKVEESLQILRKPQVAVRSNPSCYSAAHKLHLLELCSRDMSCVASDDMYPNLSSFIRANTDGEDPGRSISLSALLVIIMQKLEAPEQDLQVPSTLQNFVSISKKPGGKDLEILRQALHEGLDDDSLTRIGHELEDKSLAVVALTLLEKNLFLQALHSEIASQMTEVMQLCNN